MDQQLKQQLDQFIEDEDPNVLALRGAWGVGKTYAWNEFLRGAAERVAKRYTAYAYVSLFGPESMDVIRFQVFCNARDPRTTSAADTAAPRGRKMRALFGKSTAFVDKWLPDLQQVAEVRTIARRLLAASVSRMLICFDDLERMTPSVETSELLGFVTELSESKSCSVVMILNDERLQGPADTQYRLLQEKVIDRQVLYAPGTDHLSKVVWPSTSLAADEIAAIASAACGELGMVNLRLLFRIRKQAIEINKALGAVDSMIRRQAIRSLCLFTHCYYGDGPDVPPLEFVLKRSAHADLLAAMVSKKKEADPAVEGWGELLRRYDYTDTDDLDAAVLDVVRTGWLDFARLHRAAEQLQASLQANRARQRFMDNHEAARFTFADTGASLDMMLAEFRRDMKFLRWSDLDAAVILLRRLDREHDADELINEYCARMRAAGERPAAGEDFRDSHLASFISDPAVRAAIVAWFAAARVPKSLAEVIDGLSKKSGWDTDDEAAMVAATADDFYGCLRIADSSLARQRLKTCLKYREYVDPTASQKAIALTVMAALKRLHDESAINAARLRSLGIEIA